MADKLSVLIGVVVRTGENDVKTISVDANPFKNEQNSSVFVWKRISVDRAYVFISIVSARNWRNKKENKNITMKSSLRIYWTLSGEGGSIFQCCPKISCQRILVLSDPGVWRTFVMHWRSFCAVENIQSGIVIILTMETTLCRSILNTIWKFARISRYNFVS